MDSRVRILVVDDMPAVRLILRNMLEQAGLTNVAEAEDGETAWQIVRDSVGLEGQEIALVISDWNMPGMSGMELLRAVRSGARTRELPFLMLTAQGDRAHLDEALHGGVAEYVVKPLGPGVLAEKVTKLLKT